MSIETAGLLPTETDLDEHVERELNRVITELTGSLLPKEKLPGFLAIRRGLLEIWKKRGWNDREFPPPEAYEVLVAAFAALTLLFLATSGFGSVRFRLFFIATATLSANWAIQALVFMFRAWRKIACKEKERRHAPPPTRQQIQARFVERMQETIGKVRSDATGPDSQLGRRIAEQGRKRSEVQDVVKRLERLIHEHPNDTELPELLREAEDSLLPFERDMEALKRDQESILEILRTAQARIPQENLSLEKDAIRERIMHLQHKGKESREESKAMIIKIVTPIVRELIPLNAARERLLLLSTDGTIDTFLKAAETSATREIRFRKEIGSPVNELTAES